VNSVKESDHEKSETQTLNSLRTSLSNSYSSRKSLLFSLESRNRRRSLISGIVNHQSRRINQLAKSSYESRHGNSPIRHVVPELTSLKSFRTVDPVENCRFRKKMSISVETSRSQKPIFVEKCFSSCFNNFRQFSTEKNFFQHF
jgi:hypothetical protein